MKSKDLETYFHRQEKLLLKNRFMLLGLACALTCLWFLSGFVSPREMELMASVRQAQLFLYEKRIDRGSEDFDPDTDPYHTGFIGLEWSSLSTTLGALGAKRTSCDPRWAVVVRRWIEDLKIHRGECVAVYSSSSFPGMAFNVLKALESLGIRPLLIVSLGASTWGANDPLFPWPLIEHELKSAGLLHTKAFAYTLGGEHETGGGMSDETIALLKNSAAANGVPLVVKESLESMISWKMSLLKEYNARALISIGGSEANMGIENDILKLGPGLHRSGNAGTGVVGRALDAGYPVIYLLNIKRLAAECGVPFDSAPGTIFYGKHSILISVVAILLFIAVLAVYKRWSF